MDIYNAVLAILYSTLFVLVGTYIREHISQREQTKQEEDELERFWDELYSWGKRHSNLVNQD